MTPYEATAWTVLTASFLSIWLWLFAHVVPISYPTDCGTDEYADWYEECNNWHEFQNVSEN